MDLYFLDIFKKLSTSNSIALVSKLQYYANCLMFADFLKKTESVAESNSRKTAKFYTMEPKISQVIVIGNKRKFWSALVTLPHEQKNAEKWQSYVKNENLISSSPTNQSEIFRYNIDYLLPISKLIIIFV